MNLIIEVGGMALPWSFAGARSLHAWVRRRPWESEDVAVTLARVDVANSATLTRRALPELARSVDTASALTIRSVESDVDGLADVLTALCRMPSQTRGRRRLEALSKAFTDKRWFWVVEQYGAGTQLRGELERLFDNVRKVVGRPIHTPTVVVLDPRAKSANHALDIGFPDATWLVDSGPHRAKLWAGYVHCRVAWLAGGRPSVATVLCGPAVRQAADPEALERALNDSCCERLDELDTAPRRAIDTWVSVWPGHQANLDAELLDAGLLGRPPSRPSARPRLTPWVARALLARTPNHPRRALLRRSEVCQPLATQLLGTCMDIEATLRAHAHAAGHLELVDDGYGTLSCSRAIHDQHALVPTADPSRGRHDSDFMSLGGLIHCMPHGPTRNLAHELRDVRNLLAHGHPPSFQTLERVMTLGRRLGSA